VLIAQPILDDVLPWNLAVARSDDGCNVCANIVRDTEYDGQIYLPRPPYFANLNKLLAFHLSPISK
jgi:hypothetical protein